jgi:hypothetical protein
MSADAPTHGDAANPEPMRGVGSDPPKRADLAALRLHRHALAQGWPVPSELKNQAMKRMGQILKDDKAGDRSWVAATRSVISMTGANLQSIDTALRARQQEELDERLQELEVWRESHGQTDQS